MFQLRLVLEPGKRYSTTVDKSFHVSMAALDCSSVLSNSDILSVVLECEGQENILCNLSKQQKLLQCHLDLNFMTGDKVSFEVKGSGVVHLSGYLVPDDDDDLMNLYDNEEIAEEEEDDEEEVPTKNDKQKRKRQTVAQQANHVKKKKLDTSDNDSDEDDEIEDTSALNTDLAGDSDEEDEEDDDTDEDVSDDDDDDEEEEEEEEGLDDSEEDQVVTQTKKEQKTPQSPNKKQGQTPKQQQQSANKQNASTPLLNGTGPQQQQSGQKKKGQETPKAQAQQTPKQNSAKAKNQKTTPSRQELEGGVVVKDIRQGNGPVAIAGKMVAVYYQGKLKSTGKVFDECKKGGPAFKFRLGRGEVIKGWDIGVSGMKLGGIRSITCPPHMAYGAKGSPPQIPANSTLIFQVELKSLN